MAPLLQALLAPKTMGPRTESCLFLWARSEAGGGTGGTGSDVDSWDPPRFGSPWEKRGAGGQGPIVGSEQMAEGIIKIQLCSLQRLGLKEEEAAGGWVGVWGLGGGVWSMPKQCRTIVPHLGADFSAMART